MRVFIGELKLLRLVTFLVKESHLPVLDWLTNIIGKPVQMQDKEAWHKRTDQQRNEGTSGSYRSCSLTGLVQEKKKACINLLGLFELIEKISELPNFQPFSAEKKKNRNQDFLGVMLILR